MAQGPRSGNHNRGGAPAPRNQVQRTAVQPDVPAVKPRAGKKSILDHMAARLNMDPGDLQRTLMATVFQGASNEEFASLLVVSEAYRLNPLTKEIYAFPKKGGGIMPLVSIDGWIRITNEHPQYEGVEWEDLTTDDGTIYAIECTIYRRDRNRPVKIIEYLSECKQNTEPWRNMPARMLRHKAFIQCARYAFGFSGIYDESDVVLVDGGSDLGERTPPMRPVHTAPMRLADPGLQSQIEDNSARGVDTDGTHYDTGTGVVLDDEIPKFGVEGPASTAPEGTPPTDPSWKVAEELIDEAKEKETIMDLNSFRSRTLEQVELWPDDVQAIFHKAVDEHEAKLKGGKK